MRVAIDVSPITSGHFLQHRVRGTGFYLNNLRDALIDAYGKDEFTFIKRGERVSSAIDLIHYPYFEPFFITLPLKKPVKTVITVHDLTPLVFKNDFPVGIKGMAKWQIQKKVLKNSNLIITDSESSKKDIVRIVGYDESRVKVIYLAAAKHFRQIKDEKKKEIIKKFKLPNNFVLYVGDVTPNKNLPRLIEAINNTQHPLVIVGEAFKNTDYDKNNPWNKGLKEAQEKASKNKNILSLGFVGDEDLVALYNAAALLVMPSLYEGFGLPILEAMQSGCPVIASKSGSLSEVAGDGAFFIDPMSSESITEGIEMVLSDEKLREKLVKRGFENVKKFSWEKTARETYASYQMVVNF